jgi:hypothetical protein
MFARAYLKGCVEALQVATETVRQILLSPKQLPERCHLPKKIADVNNSRLPLAASAGRIGS